ncbi:hypothetical protein [Rhizobacter sp. Root1221]|uniref:hypothetical protein n=1 Tax=Rhizobacter sp. Root1221 TaxID=1736433 RepID=UPI000B081799|nr:hypothetical protein [Rhizobacter sp. Root1221]
MIHLLARLLPGRPRAIDENSSWRRIVYASVGGLYEVGFASDESALLAVSESGRGLFSLATGELIARDDAPVGPNSEWFDTDQRIALGIGSLTGTWIPMVGLEGGQLNRSHGEWRVELRGAGRDESALLFHARTGDKWLVERHFSTVRSYGFSPSGRFLVLATGSTLTVLSNTDRTAPSLMRNTPT